MSRDRQLDLATEIQSQQ